MSMSSASSGPIFANLARPGPRWGECKVESWKTARLITSVITFYIVLLSILLQGKELERLVSGNRANCHKVETGHS